MVYLEATGGALQILRVTCQPPTDDVRVKIGPAGTPFLVAGTQGMPSPLAKATWHAFTLVLSATETILVTPLGPLVGGPCASPQEVRLGSNDWETTAGGDKYDVRIDQVRFR